MLTSTSDRPDEMEESRNHVARTTEQRAYETYGLDKTDHHVTVDELNTRIRVVEVGSGPPVVLIPGGEGTGLGWLPLLPELDGYTRYVMDRPGGGLSDEFDYTSRPLHRIAVTSTTALFDHFDLGRAPIIGSSMGGLWTLRFALAHPDRVSAIALLGTPALYPGTSAPLPMRLGSLAPLTGFVVDRMLRPDGPDDVRDGWSFLNQSEEAIEELPEVFAEGMYRQASLSAYRTTWVGILRKALRLRGARPEAALTPDDLRAVDAPVALLWGSDDLFGSVMTGRTGAEKFADAEFHEVGTGHFPWLDEPERCGELLRDFLERNSSEPE